MNEALVYLLRSGGCLVLFYGVYWLVLRKETSFVLNRAFLVGAAVLSLVLPLLKVTSPFFETVVYASASPSPANAAFPAGGPSGPAAQTPVLLKYAVAFYAAGAAVFLALLAIRLGRLAVVARRCGCERRRGLRVIVCGHPGESFSFFNTVFLKESGLPAADTDRILAHELAHVRQGHSFDILLAEVLTVIQWFNPFVWPYKRSLRETHEYLADRAVIAQGCSPARYQLLLIEQHVGGRLVELASSFRTSRIKRRIAMLTRQETKGLARWKPLLILPLAVGLVLAFAESRTVIQEKPTVVAPTGPALGPQDVKPEGQETKAKAADQERLSDEQTMKALQEKMKQLDLKMAELEIMKQQIALDMAKLKMKLAGQIDTAVREKTQAEYTEQKLKAVEVDLKKRMVEIKELESALAHETNADKREDLKKALEDLRLEAQDCAKKAEQLRKAAEISGLKLKEKPPAEKKVEK